MEEEELHPAEKMSLHIKGNRVHLPLLKSKSKPAVQIVELHRTFHFPLKQSLSAEMAPKDLKKCFIILLLDVTSWQLLPDLSLSSVFSSLFSCFSRKNPSACWTRGRFFSTSAAEWHFPFENVWCFSSEFWHIGCINGFNQLVLSLDLKNYRYKALWRDRELQSFQR